MCGTRFGNYPLQRLDLHAHAAAEGLAPDTSVVEESFPCREKPD